MPPFLSRVIERAQSTLSGISLGQKVMSVLLAGLLALGAVFFTSWVTQPSYSPLFSNLASTDASAIVDELNAQGVKYELADGGGTVMVPKDQVYAMRLAMSGKGLPAGDTTGYSLLDKEGVTTSDFQQQVSYQRAVEGELSKTLSTMEGIRTATVRVAMPKQDVFADDNAKPTASVLVALDAGAKLTATQITAITNLVSSSIQGMTPEDVTLADTAGSVLSAAGETSGIGGSDAQSQMQADVQARLAKQGQEMLDRVLGPGKAVVKVSADLDFAARAETNKTYTYTKDTPPLSETSQSETMTGGGTQVGGVLGPQNPTGTNTTVGGNGEYEGKSETKNNAVNESVETVKGAPGTIKRMTVSVLMDDKVGGTLDKAEVEALMQTAMGFDTQRGDAMTVAAMTFDDSAAEQAKKDMEAAEAAAEREELIGYAKVAGVVLLVLIAMIIAVVKGRKRSPKGEPMTPEATAELSRIRQQIAAHEREQKVEDVLDPEATRRQQVRAEIADLIDHQPEEVTAMLRAWLAEERA